MLHILHSPHVILLQTGLVYLSKPQWVRLNGHTVGGVK